MKVNILDSLKFFKDDDSPVIVAVPALNYLGIDIKNLTDSKHSRVKSVFQGPSTSKLIAKANAKGNQQNTKPNSMICEDCDGNGYAVILQHILTRSIEASLSFELFLTHRFFV
ncbi:hypothetical protein PIB30_043481 [Stylosanthes scabra]|uniref:Uncharacterized protein n=1 Tax=Stylosanthes scabra TaxID=79078 RepID=A0ABU6ZEA3_9FABA|nr:hypothetical protein [Stylosanthes scabra]